MQPVRGATNTRTDDRPGRRAAAASFVFGALAIAAACSGGTSSSTGAATPTAPTAAVVEVATTPLGVDFGFASGAGLVAPIDDYAAAGALIPGASVTGDRRVTFVAFATAAPLDDADGAGGRLERGSDALTDSNAASDVFLMAVEDRTARVDGGAPRPVAFSRSLANVFRHDRCVHCHAMGASNGPGESDVFPANGGAAKSHPGGDQPLLTDDGCIDCHTSAVSGLDVDWRAPRENDVPPEFLDLRGLDVHELAALAAASPLDAHLLVDSTIDWALDHGLVPPSPGVFAGSSSVWDGLDVDVGPVPISSAAFREQLVAWEAAGAPTTASGAVLDVRLVSRANRPFFLFAAGNGPSGEPDVTWVPDPSFDPTGGGVQRAGRVFVAFTSRATNLVMFGSITSDVYVGEFDVTIDLDSAERALSISEVKDVVLVSRPSGGSFGGNADSHEPSIDASGTRIAFTSTATNLVAGFTDGNGGGTDVFLRDTAFDTTELVSTDPFATAGPTGGNGSSSEPDVAPNGEVVVFSSTASDLVLGDGNGLRDVYCWRASGGAVLERVSVSTSGAEAVGGASLAPSVGLFGGEPVIAFESSATNLDDAGATNGTQVFLRADGETLLLSRANASGYAGGDGASRAPAVDPDGSVVVFASDATDIDVALPADANGARDVFLVELDPWRDDGSVEAWRVNTTALGGESSGAADDPCVVAFASPASASDVFHAVLVRTDEVDLGVTAEPLVVRWIERASATKPADFVVESANGTAPFAAAFQDASTGLVTGFAWDFGDGGVSHAQNPVHVYTEPGTYTVSLAVTRPGGHVDVVTKSALVTVAE